MLQRAASNAYSWWWAGHIRTKQSKWLEQSLQDMDEKVQYVLGLIQEEGDSFAKRAEMYYKRRPELVSFVEESYRAFRALAERYDHLSTELQNANNTLATCFPEQFQLPMDEDDEFGTPRGPRIPPQVPAGNAPKVPKVPKAPAKDLRGLLKTAASKQRQNKKPSKADDSDLAAPKSGLSKDEAVEEIDKLQKDILSLQTVKEFVKSSYQSGIEKYWNIENTIMEKQQKVCRLQDEFGINKSIDDDEARKLMAGAALRSCQETLSQLQETQKKSAKDAKEEGKKIEDACLRIKCIRHQYLHEQPDANEKSCEKDDSARTEDSTRISSQDLGGVIQETQEKAKLQVDAITVSSSISVTELAEKIDDLVSKVISLESSVSSQTALIERLRSEARELHAHIQTLEDDKATLTEGKQDLTKRVKELEEKLSGVQDLNQNVESQNSNLETHFAEAQSSLDHLSEKLSSVKPDDEPDCVRSSIDQEGSEDISKTGDADVKEGPNSSASGIAEKPSTKRATNDPNEETEKEEMNWQMMLLSGEKDKENILLTEYMTILRNYKDVKRKLTVMEKKDKRGQSDVSVQVRELKNVIAKRDEEIQQLRGKLNALQGVPGETSDVKEVESSTSGPSDDQRAEDADGNKSFPDKEADDFNFELSDQPMAMSPVAEQLRMEIDGILDENLDFWLRFSTAFHQIQKFKNTVEDLEEEISQIREKQQQQEDSVKTDVKSEVRPIHKHLREIQTELTMWLEHSEALKAEMERRFSSLCSIQEKISLALKEGVEEEEIRFSSHQAAKFQGEVLNMKQENNKVREELQAGVDHITSLQAKVDKTLNKLNEEFGLAGSQSQLGNSPSRSRIPLRNFIFGTKKKQKHSIFSRMNPNRKYQVLRAGLPM